MCHVPSSSSSVNISTSTWRWQSGPTKGWNTARNANSSSAVESITVPVTGPWSSSSRPLTAMSAAGMGADHSPVTSMPFCSSIANASPATRLPSNSPCQSPVIVTGSGSGSGSGRRRRRRAVVAAAAGAQQREAENNGPLGTVALEHETIHFAFLQAPRPHLAALPSGAAQSLSGAILSNPVLSPELVRTRMESAVKLAVPLTVDVVINS